MSRKHKAPSLESLVNQCCEDYYFKLSQTLDQIKSPSKDSYFSYEKFSDYIQSSHCQENLKFLIEIYHYEKIWNKIFKRQSSILKCKDELTQQLQLQQQQQRKLSVATIFTNSSSRRRHPSIIELPEPGDAGHTEEEDEHGQQQRMDSIHSLDNEDIHNLVSELTIPHVVTTHEDMDARSFADLDGPRSLVPESPVSPSAEDDDDDSDPLSGSRPLTHTHTHHSQRSNSNWDSLFKPGYQCDDNHACLCNVASHEHNHINIPETPTKRSNSAEEFEYNESVKQMEVREQLKEELAEKFEYIITYYVMNNSPYEINLPSEVYKDLVQEYENTKILYHSPLTLLPAKNAVLQLLRENIYYKFLSEQERLISREDSVRMIKDSRTPAQQTIPQSRSIPTIHTTAPPNASSSLFNPKYAPVSIHDTKEANDNVTRDFKNLHIDTPNSNSSTTTATSASTPSGAGPMSSFSTFLKTHLKHTTSPSSTGSAVSTDPSITPTSVSSIQRTQTFAGQTLSPTTDDSPRRSVVELGKEKEDHRWGKLLRFKKKKSVDQN